MVCVMLHKYKHLKAYRLFSVLCATKYNFCSHKYKVTAHTNYDMIDVCAKNIETYMEYLALVQQHRAHVTSAKEKRFSREFDIFCRLLIFLFNRSFSTFFPSFYFQESSGNIQHGPYLPKAHFRPNNAKC